MGSETKKKNLIIIFLDYIKKIFSFKKKKEKNSDDIYPMW